MSKPSIPKGTRDFLPQQMVKRNYLFDTLKSIFKKYAFLPIETPAVENLSTLMGKYGEEGDRLIFKILNSGDYLSGVENLAAQNSTTLTKEISEKALRYDLTVPFARFVVQNQNDLHFPFKRFQIQPVWRADRPQKGRYREFFQCDADIIGSDSLLNELDLILLMNDAFSALNLPVTIKINNRKILAGIAEVMGVSDKIVDVTVAIDKLEKIGFENVKKELLEKGLSEKAIAHLDNLIGGLPVKSPTSKNRLQQLKEFLVDSEIGMKGIEEVEYILNEIDTISQSLYFPSLVELDITLARGLNYYTGAIFEVKANIGTLQSSICGGGRYDDLTGIFGLKGLSGVGISFGADRIYDVLEEANKFPENLLQTTDVLFVNFGDAEALYSMKVMQQLRAHGISCELYPSSAKMQKQMTYANNKYVRFVAMIGTNEMNENKVSLKNMKTGEQKMVDTTNVINEINH